MIVITDRYRLGLLMLLLTCVRLVFRHLDATFPKYVKRALPPNTPYGSLYAINPFTIIFLVPITQLVRKLKTKKDQVFIFTNFFSFNTPQLLRNFDPFDCILIGSFIAAGSVLWLTVANSVATAVAFVVTLSLGEAVYSPKVYEYTMLVAPKGNEALYTNLASVPMFW